MASWVMITWQLPCEWTEQTDMAENINYQQTIDVSANKLRHNQVYVQQIVTNTDKTFI